MSFHKWLTSSFCFISGMDASVAVKTTEIEVFSRLQDIIITNVDPKTIHKKVMYCTDSTQTRRPNSSTYLMKAL